MSDNGFLKKDKVRSVLSRIKTRVGSDIASAISESTLSLTSIINSGDSTTLGSAKGYADGLKIVIDSNISTGDTNTLNNAKSYTDAKTQNKFELEDLTNSPVDVGDIIVANDQAGLKGKSSGVKLSNLANASHTHTVNDISDASTELAVKNHTHTESDITDLQNYSLMGHTHSTSDITDLSTAISTDLQHFIRCYETADLDSVSMEDGESFLYFDLTTGELCKRSKSGDDITTTRIGKLSAIEE